MAIRSLGLTSNEYLRCMFYPESLYIQKSDPDNAVDRLQELQLQTALVLYSIQEYEKVTTHSQEETPIKEEAEDLRGVSAIDKWLAEWKKQINKFQSYFEQEKVIPYLNYQDKAIMLQTEYLALLHYLKKCNEAISNGLKSDDTKSEQNELHTIFNAVRKGFDLEKVHIAVANYRNMLLL